MSWLSVEANTSIQPQNGKTSECFILIYNFIHSKDAEARGEIADGINIIWQSMIKVHIANIIFFVKTNFVVIIDCK